MQVSSPAKGPPVGAKQMKKLPPGSIIIVNGKKVVVKGGPSTPPAPAAKSAQKVIATPLSPSSASPVSYRQSTPTIGTPVTSSPLPATKTPTWSVPPPSSPPVTSIPLSEKLSPARTGIPSAPTPSSAPTPAAPAPKQSQQKHHQQPPTPIDVVAKKSSSSMESKIESAIAAQPVILSSNTPTNKTISTAISNGDGGVKSVAVTPSPVSTTPVQQPSPIDQQPSTTPATKPTSQSEGKSDYSPALSVSSNSRSPSPPPSRCSCIDARFLPPITKPSPTPSTVLLPNWGALWHREHEPLGPIPNDRSKSAVSAINTKLFYHKKLLTIKIKGHPKAGMRIKPPPVTPSSPTLGSPTTQHPRSKSIFDNIVGRGRSMMEPSPTNPAEVALNDEGVYLVVASGQDGDKGSVRNPNTRDGGAAALNQTQITFNLDHYLVQSIPKAIAIPPQLSSGSGQLSPDSIHPNQSPSSSPPLMPLPSAAVSLSRDAPLFKRSASMYEGQGGGGGVDGFRSSNNQSLQGGGQTRRRLTSLIAEELVVEGEDGAESDVSTDQEEAAHRDKEQGNAILNRRKSVGSVNRKNNNSFNDPKNGGVDVDVDTTAGLAANAKDAASVLRIPAGASLRTTDPFWFHEEYFFRLVPKYVAAHTKDEFIASNTTPTTPAVPLPQDDTESGLPGGGGYTSPRSRRSFNTSLGYYLSVAAARMRRGTATGPAPQLNKDASSPNNTNDDSKELFYAPTEVYDFHCRNERERDRWVCALLKLKRAQQTEDETFPFGRDHSRDAVEAVLGLVRDHRKQMEAAAAAAARPAEEISEGESSDDSGAISSSTGVGSKAESGEMLPSGSSPDYLVTAFLDAPIKDGDADFIDDEDGEGEQLRRRRLSSLHNLRVGSFVALAATKFKRGTLVGKAAAAAQFPFQVLGGSSQLLKPYERASAQRQIFLSRIRANLASENDAKAQLAITTTTSNTSATPSQKRNINRPPKLEAEGATDQARASADGVVSAELPKARTVAVCVVPVLDPEVLELSGPMVSAFLGTADSATSPKNAHDEHIPYRTNTINSNTTFLPLGVPMQRLYSYMAPEYPGPVWDGVPDGGITELFSTGRGVGRTVSEMSTTLPQYRRSSGAPPNLRRSSDASDLRSGAASDHPHIPLLPPHPQPILGQEFERNAYACVEDRFAVLSFDDVDVAVAIPSSPDSKPSPAPVTLRMVELAVRQETSAFTEATQKQHAEQAAAATQRASSSRAHRVSSLKQPNVPAHFDTVLRKTHRRARGATLPPLPNGAIPSISPIFRPFIDVTSRPTNISTTVNTTRAPRVANSDLEEALALLGEGGSAAAPPSHLLSAASSMSSSGREQGIRGALSIPSTPPPKTIQVNLSRHARVFSMDIEEALKSEDTSVSPPSSPKFDPLDNSDLDDISSLYSSSLHIDDEPPQDDKYGSSSGSSKSPSPPDSPTTAPFRVRFPAASLVALEEYEHTHSVIPTEWTETMKFTTTTTTTRHRGEASPSPLNALDVGERVANAGGGLVSGESAILPPEEETTISHRHAPVRFVLKRARGSRFTFQLPSGISAHPRRPRTPSTATAHNNGTSFDEFDAIGSCQQAAGGINTSTDMAAMSTSIGGMIKPVASGMSQSATSYIGGGGIGAIDVLSDSGLNNRGSFSAADNPQHSTGLPLQMFSHLMSTDPSRNASFSGPSGSNASPPYVLSSNPLNTSSNSPDDASSLLRLSVFLSRANLFSNKKKVHGFHSTAPCAVSILSSFLLDSIVSERRRSRQHHAKLANVKEEATRRALRRSKVLPPRAPPSTKGAFLDAFIAQGSNWMCDLVDLGCRADKITKLSSSLPVPTSTRHQSSPTPHQKGSDSPKRSPKNLILPPKKLINRRNVGAKSASVIRSALPIDAGLNMDFADNGPPNVTLMPSSTPTPQQNSHHQESSEDDTPTHVTFYYLDVWYMAPAAALGTSLPVTLKENRRKVRAVQRKAYQTAQELMMNYGGARSRMSPIPESVPQAGEESSRVSSVMGRGSFDSPTKGIRSLVPFSTSTHIAISPRVSCPNSRRDTIFSSIADLGGTGHHHRQSISSSLCHQPPIASFVLSPDSSEGEDVGEEDDGVGNEKEVRLAPSKITLCFASKEEREEVRSSLEAQHAIARSMLLLEPVMNTLNSDAGSGGVAGSTNPSQILLKSFPGLDESTPPSTTPIFMSLEQRWARLLQTSIINRLRGSLERHANAIAMQSGLGPKPHEGDGRLLSAVLILGMWRDGACVDSDMTTALIRAAVQNELPSLRSNRTDGDVMNAKGKLWACHAQGSRAQQRGSTLWSNVRTRIQKGVFRQLSLECGAESHSPVTSSPVSPKMTNATSFSALSSGMATSSPLQILQSLVAYMRPTLSSPPKQPNQHPNQPRSPNQVCSGSTIDGTGFPTFIPPSIKLNGSNSCEGEPLNSTKGGSTSLRSPLGAPFPYLVTLDACAWESYTGLLSTGIQDVLELQGQGAVLPIPHPPSSSKMHTSPSVTLHPTLAPLLLMSAVPSSTDIAAGVPMGYGGLSSASGGAGQL